MKSQSLLFAELWQEARTRFNKQLLALSQEDLKKRLGDSPNSAGFLIRHIADVELLFAKNVFGKTDLPVRARTVIAKKDTGEWTDLQELKDYAGHSENTFFQVILKQQESNWQTNISTKEFGTRTKAEALGRIISHTAYHAGQLAIIKKYGRP